MNHPAQVLRLLHINYILMRYRLDRLLLITPRFKTFSFLTYLNPWNWYASRSHSRGESIRLALEQLGPIFVKFGQILSTRRDLIPEDIAEELAKLQDRVLPFSGEVAKKIIENEFKKPIEDLFSVFDPVPLASASIAQVHAATLHNGKNVVVKVVRPNIKKLIRHDLNLMLSVATLTTRLFPKGRRLKPREVVLEFEKTLTNELDLRHEAANASQLRRNFLNSDLLYIPEVHWEFSRKNILVMERINGIPISAIKTLEANQINLKKLAEKGVEIFFTQVFRDSFFHADMHPGNIFVATHIFKDPYYLAVDFGIVGVLSPLDQRYLAENLLAFFRRDYRRVAALHMESGWIDPHIRSTEFEQAIRSVCEPIFERPLKDISFGKLLLNLFQTAGRFNMEVQPQLLLLQKTLVNIEGLGRELYPELDLWSTAKPYLENWLRERTSPKAIIKKIYEKTPYWAERLLEAPELLFSTLETIKQDNETSLQKKQNVSQKKDRFWQGVIAGVIITGLIALLILH